MLISYLSTLGIGVIAIQFILGQQLSWSVPGITFIVLVAVGADYNMLLISRVRDQSPYGVRSGVIRTVGSTGGVITSAGTYLRRVHVWAAFWQHRRHGPSRFHHRSWATGAHLHRAHCHGASAGRCWSAAQTGGPHCGAQPPHSPVTRTKPPSVPEREINIRSAEEELEAEVSEETQECGLLRSRQDRLHPKNSKSLRLASASDCCFYDHNYRCNQNKNLGRWPGESVTQ